jgi:CelD/BcsL family acetyltransferase involved in cellulose biosynthesis
MTFDNTQKVRQFHRTKEAAWPLVTQETIGSSLWSLELKPLEFDGDWRIDLAALAQHSGGVNIFFEQAFQEAAIGRIGNAARVVMLLKETIGDDAVPRLAFPFTEERVGFSRVRVLRAFSHPFAPLSTPLVDLRKEAEEAIDRFAALLARLSPTMPLIFEDFAVGEPTARELMQALASHGFCVTPILSRERSVLKPSLDVRPDGFPDWLSRKTRRETSRLARRLAEVGKVEFETATDYLDVINRFEEFIALEARGWKGRNGSSLLAIKKTAAFARQSISDLAKERRASIHTLRLDGIVLASLIMLRSRDRYYPWKIAFDEGYGAYSPGIILMLESIKSLLSTPGFELADTLSAEGSWIERILSDRIELATLVVSLDPAKAGQAARALERFDAAKRFAKRLIGRGTSVPSKLPHAPARGKPGE